MPTMMMMMENGFSSSPRPTDSFPAGLRVLVVDDDPTWLKILERMLRKCSYEVTTCGLARDALRLLRERKDGFDIVISDVNMPDMDGFKLLEHVGLEMDLPVIMMSVDGETSRVMKGVQHGACDYLLKPIRMKELKNIWQHVLRKRMHDVKDIESSHDNIDDDDLHLFKYVSENSDCEQFLRGADQIFLKKRKDLDSKYGVKDSNDPSAKRPRVVWSVDLHQKFVKAVNQIGFDRVGPKKILDMMNVPWLTRENVASHLQKYRLYLSRLEKENEPKGGCGGGFKNSDQSPKDSGGGFAIQTPTVTQQSEVSVVSLRCPAQSIDTKTDDIGPKGINLWPFPDGNPFTSDVSSVYRAESSPKMGLDSSHGSLKPEISYDPPLASQSSWSGEVKHSPFEYEHKPHQQFVEMPFVNERHNLSSSKSSALNLDIFGLMANTSVDFSQQATQIGLSGFELGTRNHISGSESAFGSLNDDFSFYLLPGDNFGTSSMGFDNTGFSEYNFPDLINGVPRFNFEYFGDSMEYAVLDQGLFIS